MFLSCHLKSKIKSTKIRSKECPWCKRCDFDTQRSSPAWSLSHSGILTMSVKEKQHISAPVLSLCAGTSLLSWSSLSLCALLMHFHFSPLQIKSQHCYAAGKHRCLHSQSSVIDKLMSLLFCTHKAETLSVLDERVSEYPDAQVC